MRALASRRTRASRGVPSVVSANWHCEILSHCVPHLFMMEVMKASFFEEFGTSDVLRYGDLPRPVRNDNEFLVQTEYIGLNFADIYRRRGEYHIEHRTPYVNGYEASGTIVEADDKCLIGKPVLFVDVPFANAELVAVPEDHAIFLPEQISLKLAATVGLQGLTADFLAHDLGRNHQGEKAFVTGVSGGVGQILAQILIADGVEVYGSASSEAKRQVALNFGVREVFPSRESGWVADQKGRFDTVYDGVGSTLNQSISLLKNRGSVVFFGMAGGDPPAVDLVDLLAHSTCILTGDLWDYLTSSAERQIRSGRLFNYLLDGRIIPTEPTVFPLADAKLAHDRLESGRNIGKILLKP